MVPSSFCSTRKEALAIAVWESPVVKNELGSRAAIREFELHNRVDARFPVRRTPSLDNSLIAHKLDLPPHDKAAERRESTTGFRTDFRGRGSRGHACLHGITELHDVLELFSVCEHFVDAFPAGFEIDFLVNRLFPA